MARKNHDWLSYKQDFFNSDIDEVKHFFDTRLAHVSANSYKRRTSGWAEEKRAYRQKQAEAARAKMANNPDVKDLTKQLIKSKENALKIVMHKLVKEKDDLGMRDLREGLDILKRELGEPLTISENKNKNKNEFSLGEDFERLLSGYVGLKQVDKEKS